MRLSNSEVDAAGVGVSNRVEDDEAITMIVMVNKFNWHRKNQSHADIMVIYNLGGKPMSGWRSILLAILLHIVTARATTASKT